MNIYDDRNIPFTGMTAEAIRAAQKIAKGNDHGYVGIDHVLVAIFRTPDSPASHYLTTLGFTEEAAAKAFRWDAPPKDLHQNPAMLEPLEKAKTLTPKQRVLEKFPHAVCTDCCDAYRVWENGLKDAKPIGEGWSAREAWSNAAHRLPTKKNKR